MPPASPPDPRGPAGRFAVIIDGLCRAVAARAARDRAATALLVLVWGMLRRMAVRLATLAAQASAGTLPRHRARAPRAPRRQSLRPRQRLPAGFAWLVRLAPEAAGYGGQLQHLLADPEMAALLAAAPQAGRILRPLCRMLAVPPTPALQPPPDARPPRPQRSGTPGEPAIAERPVRPPGRGPRPRSPGPPSLTWRGVLMGLPPPEPGAA